MAMCYCNPAADYTCPFCRARNEKIADLAARRQILEAQESWLRDEKRRAETQAAVRSAPVVVVERPVIVRRTIEVERPVYIERPVVHTRTVYRDGPDPLDLAIGVGGGVLAAKGIIAIGEALFGGSGKKGRK